MAKRSFATGEFKPKNPTKYIGKHPIVYRSSWELAFMQKLDSLKDIEGWASESFSIAYRNPLTGKSSNYIPDFFVVYTDVHGKRHVEMIEVKPMKETPGYKGKVDKRTKLVQAINAAKWTAAVEFCRRRGWNFRIATEQDLFVTQKGWK